jgi:hypothetical protein
LNDANRWSTEAEQNDESPAVSSLLGRHYNSMYAHGRGDQKGNIDPGRDIY